MVLYGQEPDRGRGEAHRSDPSQPYEGTTSGLSISVPRQAHRSESRQRLVDDAEPVASSSSPAGHPQTPSPLVPSRQWHADESESWTPQHSGRTMGESSPGPGLQNQTPTVGEFKGSIYSAWDRGSAAAAYAPLVDEKDLGLAGNEDNISLDSLQMHDEGPRAYDSSRNLTTVQDVGQGDYDSFKKKINKPKHSSRIPAHLRIGRGSWLYIWLIAMSVYSTILSGIWLGVAIAQPRWGHKISSDGDMTLSTANLLIVGFAKSIEMSFATVFVAFVGQILIRRAINMHEGITMAEMIMRGWITSPGSLLSNGNTLRYTGYTLLGILTLLATAVATLYTTASDTMVRPKLRFNSWQEKELKGYVLASYSNPVYVQNSCATPISSQLDPLSAGESCLAIQYSGNSYRNLLSFMSAWRDNNINGNTASRDMTKRPSAQAMLYDNITMTGSWIETEYSNTSERYETYQRVINNVSLALPHPGVYKAGTNDENDILQPSDLGGHGAYNISASVVSPAINVLCVNMNKTELEPLVYTAWPNANSSDNENPPYQATGWDGWESDVPVASGDGEWLNSTVVDDIFRWGEKYDRRPPVFQLYPADNNIITNTTVLGTNVTLADAIYLFGKSRLTDDYTLCEMRSWPAVQCSTLFDNSGITGKSLSARCSQTTGSDDDDDEDSNPDAYENFMEPGTVSANADWKNLVEVWRLSINLDVGVDNANASNARLLTELALTAPELNDTLPSEAEALAVLASSTLVTGSVDSPFKHYWDYHWPNMTSNTLPSPGALATFRARVRTQEYASWYTSPWQGIFYVVLGAAFLLNLLCLAYLCRVGLVKDFLEPTTLFALATAKSGPWMAPTTPTEPKKPAKTDLVVPYRLTYMEDADVYYFEEASDGNGRGARTTGAAVDEGGGGRKGSLYRLSSRLRL